MRQMSAVLHITLRSYTVAIKTQLANIKPDDDAVRNTSIFNDVKFRSKGKDDQIQQLGPVR